MFDFDWFVYGIDVVCYCYVCCVGYLGWCVLDLYDVGDGVVVWLFYVEELWWCVCDVDWYWYVCLWDGDGVWNVDEW